jgi:tyrosine-protein kinase Etk/Wzc
MPEARTSTVDAPQADPYAFDEGPEDSINLVAVFQCLRAERKRILSFTLAVTILAVVVAYVLPVEYTSTVSFIPPSINSPGSSLSSSIAGQLSTLGASDLLSTKSPGDLYAGILRSRSIAETLIKRFDLMRLYRVKKMSVAEKKLAADTEVTVDAKTGIIALGVTARTPQLAHDIADGYMDALHNTNGRLALTQASQRRLFFGQQLDQEKNALEDAEVELRKTEEQTGLIAPSGQTETEIRTIAETQAQIAVRKVELAALRQSATDQNPQVIRLQSEIGDLEGQLATLQKGRGGDSGFTIPTSKVPQVQLDYVRKEREVKYHEALFEMLSRQYEAARLDEARDAPMVQVLDPPSWPDTKSSPRRMLIAVAGLLAGLLLGSISALIRGSRFALAGEPSRAASTRS